MERRTRRTRSKKEEEQKKPPASPARKRNPTPTVKRASPVRTKLSPVRRSSRPRSVALIQSSSATTVTPPSPIKEVKDTEKKTSQKTNSNLPSTLTTTTSSPAPAKSTSTSSVHSSYSSTTQQTIEIRSSAAVEDKVVSKIADYIRRSMSKSVVDGVTNRRPRHDTETESHYSRSVSRSVYDDDDDDDKSSKEEFSDTENKSINEPHDENEHYKSFSTTQHARTATMTTASPPRRKIETPREFGGTFGITLLLIIVPTLVYYLQWTCGKNSCEFKSLSLKSIADTKYLLEKVFPIDAVIGYTAFNLIIFVLSGVLYGKHIILNTGVSRQVYHFNALSIALIVTVAAAIAEYFKYPVADFILRHYLRYCLYGFVNAFIVAQWCYLRSRIQIESSATTTTTTTTLTNPYGKTGNVLIDFSLGRQLNPKWFGFIDYKQAFYRISLISTLLLAECILYKKIRIPTLLTGDEKYPPEFSWIEIVRYHIENIDYDAGTILAGSLLIFYILDAIIFEHHLVSSFELKDEGFGCLLLVRYAATPFLLSSIVKYFFDRRMPNISNNYIIFGCWTLLISGLIVKRLSSAIKYKYRIDPLNPHFNRIESIHTFQGRRLLIDGFWGKLRQPNYTGDIIALIALAMPLYLRFSWPPFISIGLLIVHLLHRTVRVNVRNIARYHSSWVRYCTRVPYYILPKIY